MMEAILKDIVIAFTSSLFGLAFRRPRVAFKIVIALLIFVLADHLMLNYESSRWQKGQIQLAESVAQSWSLFDSVQIPASKSHQRALVKIRATMTQLLQHHIEATETHLEELKNAILVAYLILLALAAFCMLLMTVKNRRSSEIL